MAFTRRVPASYDEFAKNITKLAENKSHINSVSGNASNSHLEVDLDWAANKMGGDDGRDFYVPIRRGQVANAARIAEGLLRSRGAPPAGDLRTLYDLIDASVQ
jgi:hypothetical protein